MSSHHFVREDQEPAVFVLEQVNQGILFQLLEWSPRLIVAQKAVELITSLGVKIDVVLCDEDLCDNFRDMLAFQMPVRFVVMEQNETCYAQGISFLVRQGCKAVHILGEIPYEEMKQLSVAFPLDIAVWNNDYKWNCCRSGQFRKWVTAGSSFIINAREQIKFQVDTTFKRRLVHDDLIVDLLEDGMISFQCMGPFWLGEYIN
ncbi:hypothetical protein JMN32_26245 [Fulvivirga sp. 29W222]|uniref:Uncharacterized protein n=1 Tax=Fulvivirga marina TaxID=2494733 RepID=A0A937KGV5_9BACT|nr:hypothetical protein [Fulvivirga marina]MBL6449840.1 hypothetical protein [Fulvivirga marina]